MRRPFFAIALLSIASAACGDAGSASNNVDLSTSKTDSYEISDAAVVNQPTSTHGASANSNMAANVSLGRQLVRKQIAQKMSLAEATRIEQAPLSFDRKIVRNAELQLETAKPEEAQRQIASIAESSGGFVVDSQQSMTDVRLGSRDSVAMTIRVPSHKFAGSLDDIRRTADRVISENAKGEDVTEEFIDVVARLKAQKSLEQQFMEIMKRAYSVDDALSVQSQLADVRGEIEKIEGRKRFLESLSSLSTIKIRLQTPAAISTSSDGINTRVNEAFSRGSDFALNFVLGLVTILIAVLPFAVFVGLPAALVFRYFWRKQDRPRSVSDIADEEISIS